MIDLRHLEKYRENNRIEAKKAVGGLPHSIWETYSAFANTMGGLILLGVEERKDKSLHPVELPDPEGLARTFLTQVNDPAHASINILAAGDVAVEEAEGRQIVVIRVPRAERSDKPVYVEGDTRNTYRRNGEGDYRCSREEYAAMVRDAAVRSRDARLLEELGPEALAEESVETWLARWRTAHPEQGESDLLLRAGALGADGEGALHPTAAGLLMFGRRPDIERRFPAFELAYREESGVGAAVCRDNVYEFYRSVCQALRPAVQGPEEEDTPVFQAVREALVNCLSNADYRGRGGVSVTLGDDRVVFSNPGAFRISVSAARSGGLSDPRNGVMLRLFNAVDAGKGAGSGIPNMFRVWREQGWEEPTITQSFDPERTTITLRFTRRSALLPRQASDERGRMVHAAAGRAMVIDYLTERSECSGAELARLTGMRPAEVAELLRELEAEGIVAPAPRRGRYRLRA